ncbi:MAG: hypothetical protein KH129_13460, partial [Bacteroides uniformis]|uniref:hypothetical protein n=1 Tax=Bacteroides uniformis TaxID=820 RepID=UPI001F2715C5
HLSAVQASACAGRNAEDEIFHGRADIQNSFEIINEKISGGMFDTIRHPFFCIIYVRLTEEFKF